MTRSRICNLDLPPVSPGMTIGLYGGSFNPPHEGHRHVAVTALRRLKLDRIWCLVTPGNPLKDTSDLPSLSRRMQTTAVMMDHPKIEITGAEQRAGTRYTAETLDWILSKNHGTRFVWIMGADNLKQFHKWQRWESILERIPVAIVDRPGYSLAPLYATAARHFASSRIPDHLAGGLAQMPCPAWTFLYGPRSDLSSTALRKRTNRLKVSKE